MKKYDVRYSFIETADYENWLQLKESGETVSVPGLTTDEMIALTDKIDLYSLINPEEFYKDNLKGKIGCWAFWGYDDMFKYYSEHGGFVISENEIEEILKKCKNSKDKLSERNRAMMGLCEYAVNVKTNNK